MKLSELIYRNPVPEPWSEGEKIPWNDPAFSQRMLEEHLSQAHDLASRRFAKIDQHIRWIHDSLLEGPTRILDLGCGPGFYTNRLAKLGHSTVGIDYSPASIAYAREIQAAENLKCEYHLEDMRTADYGSGFGLVMMLFGEFNTFRPSEARMIVKKVCSALDPGGVMLLELSSCDAVYDLGQSPSTWYAVPAGLFSDRPHLCLMEKFYDNQMAVTIERYWIVDIETGDLTRYAQSNQGYTRAELQDMLENCGYQKVEFFADFGEDSSLGDENFLVVCRKSK